MKYSFFFAFLLCWSIMSAQTTTYEIDYSYDQGLGSGCNVFSTEKTINGFKHQTTKGTPKYTIDTHNGSHIDLACKRNSSSSQLGTDYQILFPFKKDYKYQINVLYKGSYASGEFVPIIGLKMNVTKKTHNTSVSCTGAQSIDIGQYQGQGVSGLGFAWPSSPLITTGALTQDYESLSIAALTTQSPSATQPQGIQVRTIKIVEVAPAPTVVNDDYTGAISLTPDSPNLIRGGTTGATSSVQALPSCFLYPDIYNIHGDVWYKFIATSANHTVKLENVTPKGNYGVLPGLAVYNSSLDQIACSMNRDVSMTSLTIGQTYYIRVWTATPSAYPVRTMDFDIVVVNSGNTFILGLEPTHFNGDVYDYMSSAYIHYYIYKVNYVIDPSIPLSDITFEWSWGSVNGVDDFGVYVHNTNQPDIAIFAGTDGDTGGQLYVRIKRISTNAYLTDWYKTYNTLWFG